MSSSADLLRCIAFAPYRRGMGPRFTLRMWDAHARFSDKDAIRYELKMGRTVLFSGADFGASPAYAMDSNEAVCSLMNFLTLKPGDTDGDYFEGYTDAQRAFAEEHAEALHGEVEARFGRDGL